MAQYVKNNTNYHGARSKTSVTGREATNSTSRKGKKKNLNGGNYKNGAVESRNNSSNFNGSNRNSRSASTVTWDDGYDNCSTWENGWEANAKSKRENDRWAYEQQQKRKESSTLWNDIEQDFPPIGSQSAPTPNVWEERRKKREEMICMAPTNEKEEERMLRLALEMSKRESTNEANRNRKLEEEYQIQEALLRENPSEFSEFLLHDDTASGDNGSYSNDNWNSEGYATASGNNHVSKSTSDFHHSKSEGWKSTTKKQFDSDNWDDVDETISSNDNNGTWDDYTDQSISDHSTSKGKQIYKDQKRDCEEKKSESWNKSKNSHTDSSSTTKFSDGWDEPTANNSATIKTRNKGKTFWRDESANEYDEQSKEKIPEPMVKTKSVPVSTRDSKVEISKVVDMFGGWGSSSDFIKNSHVGKGVTKSTESKKNYSNASECDSIYDKRVLPEKNSLRPNSNQNVSSLKKNDVSIGGADYNSESSSIAQLDDFGGRHSETDTTELLKNINLSEDYSISRTNCQSLKSDKPNSEDLSLLDYSSTIRNTDKVISSNAVENSLIYGESSSDIANKEKNTSCQNLNTASKITTLDGMIGNPRIDSPSLNLESHEKENTLSTDFSPIRCIKSPQPASDFQAKNAMKHLNYMNTDPHAKLTNSYESLTSGDNFETSESSQLHFLPKLLSYIDPSTMPDDPVTRIDSPKPALSFPLEDLDINALVKSPVSSEEFKVPDLTPLQNPTENSGFINPPNVHYKVPIPLPQPTHELNSPLHQFTGHDNSSLNRKHPTPQSFPSTPMMGDMMNPNMMSSMMNPNLMGGMMNPNMMGGMMNPNMMGGMMNPNMMGGMMNTFLLQQMLFLNNPIARQLQVMEMYYRCVGVPTAQQNQLFPQMSSITNISAQNSLEKSSINASDLPFNPNMSDSIISPPYLPEMVNNMKENIGFSSEARAVKSDYRYCEVSQDSFERDHAESLLSEFLPKKKPSNGPETSIPPPVDPFVITNKVCNGGESDVNSFNANTQSDICANAPMSSSDKLSDEYGHSATSSDWASESIENFGTKNAGKASAVFDKQISSEWGDVDEGSSFNSKSNWDDDVDGWGSENFTTKSMGNPSNYDSKKNRVNRQPSSQPNFSRFKK